MIPDEGIGGIIQTDGEMSWERGAGKNKQEKTERIQLLIKCRQTACLCG